MSINARHISRIKIQKPLKRGKTLIRDIGYKTKASIFHQKLFSFTKNTDVIDILEKEFEQMVIWFSDFNDK